MTGNAKVAQAIENRFGDNQRAADWLHKELKKRKSAIATEIKPKSLAVVIGGLISGERLPWWKARMAASEPFAQALGMPVEDLLEGAPASKNAIGLPEFPGLAPLELSDGPCALWKAGWLTDLALGSIAERGEHRWIVAPAGWGKSLLVRWVEAVHDGAIVGASATTLTAAGAHAGIQKPLVVEIEMSAPNDAAAARTFLNREHSSVILAPFPPPHASSASEWHVLRLPEGLAWRERLLSWVDRRLERGDRETKFDPRLVAAWLERHDAHGELVASPGDLLALCADFDRESDEATLAARARRWLERFGFRALTGPGRAWGDRLGTDALSQMVGRRFASIAQAHGAAEAEEWSSLLPAGAVPAKDTAEPGALVAVGYLREAGVLRGDAGGLLPFPRWAHQGLLHAALAPYLTDKAIESWGALAADESRRQAIDYALDELDEQAFLSVVRRVAKTAYPSTLSAVGAVESTFSAASRRLRDPAFTLPQRDLPAWQSLAALQAGTLVPHPVWKGLHHPFTRRSPIASWILDAWRFSFRVEPPRAPPGADLAWELPGWFAPLDLPGDFRLPEPSSFAGMEEDLAPLSALVAAAAKPAQVPAGMLSLLAPSFLFASSDKEWGLDGSHLRMLARGQAWSPVALASAIRRVPEDRWPLVAQRVWRLCPSAMRTGNWGRYGVAARLYYLLQEHQALAAKVLSHLDWSSIEETLETDGLFGDSLHTAALEALPRKLLARVLGAWFDRPSEGSPKWREAQDLAPLFVGADIEMVLDLVRRADVNVAAEFASLLWHLEPSRAREEARTALETGSPSAEGWFGVAPREALPWLADVMEGHSKPPTWLSAWAYRRVLEAGAAQERLYRWARAS